MGLRGWGNVCRHLWRSLRDNLKKRPRVTSPSGVESSVTQRDAGTGGEGGGGGVTRDLALVSYMASHPKTKCIHVHGSSSDSGVLGCFYSREQCTPSIILGCCPPSCTAFRQRINHCRELERHGGLVFTRVVVYMSSCVTNFSGHPKIRLFHRIVKPLWFLIVKCGLYLEGEGFQCSSQLNT